MFLKILWKLLEFFCHAGCKLFPHISVRQGLPFDPASHTCLHAIFCSAKVLKIIESKKQGGKHLTILPLVSLEHPTLPKTNLMRQCNIYQRLLRHTRFVPCVLVDSSVLEKGIHNTEPLLQQSCNYKCRTFSLNAGSPCQPITPFHVSLSIPMCALKYPKENIDFIDTLLYREHRYHHPQSLDLHHNIDGIHLQ